MLMRCNFLAISLVDVILIGANAACSQAYPNKPIRVITSEVGGNGDFTARLIGQAITRPLGQNVIVDNRPSSINPEIVRKASPDGYTLLVDGNTLWIAPLLQKLPYDPVKDFSPITLATIVPQILVIHPSVAVNSVKGLIALAKAEPGVLNYASSSSGGPIHLAAELFKSMAGVDIVRIPYKGGGPVTSAIIAGQVQLAFPSAPAVASYVTSGRLRALAVTSAKPSILVPGVPTLAASGLPGYELVTMFGVFAPTKTTVTIIHRLNQEIVRVLSNADVKEKFLNSGAEAVSSSSEQLASMVRSDMTRMNKLIKDARITAD